MRKFLALMPLQRLIFYFVILSLLPVFLVIYHFNATRGELNQLHENIEKVRLLALQKEQKQSLNEHVRKLYVNAEPFYLDQTLESLSFLKKEKEALEHLFQNKTFTGNEAAENRYHFLIGDANRIQLKQENVQNGDGIQETIETFTHTIETDGNDIKEILARIEGKRSGQPQLLITDFKLVKKSPPQQNEVYELNLKLLKREFLTP